MELDEGNSESLRCDRPFKVEQALRSAKKLR
jgi:hypothetical protein